ESLTCNEWKSFCLTNLTRADIDCFHGHLTLKVVHNVPSMRFEIDQDYSYNDFFIPTFHNLTQLELLSLNYSWRFLRQVLNHCPMLQKLKINEADVAEETWNRKDDKENWVDPDVVPQCLSLHLRTCDLVNFLGLQGELLLAKYILKNAKVLQTMRIWNWGQPNIKKLLSTCPRASATCRLTLYHFQCKLLLLYPSCHFISFYHAIAPRQSS
ncbi:F-box/RNI/FBD-like domain protein, partial [Trifolium medium]|nr:F-box/RNI/FBD-like domain protein [Trifolium medium]